MCVITLCPSLNYFPEINMLPSTRRLVAVFFTVCVMLQIVSIWNNSSGGQRLSAMKMHIVALNDTAHEAFQRIAILEQHVSSLEGGAREVKQAPATGPFSTCANVIPVPGNAPMVSAETAVPRCLCILAVRRIVRESSLSVIRRR